MSELGREEGSEGEGGWRYEGRGGGGREGGEGELEGRSE